MLNVARIVSRTFDLHCINGPVWLSLRHNGTVNLLKDCKKIPGFRMPTEAKKQIAVFLKDFPRVVSDLTTNDDDTFKHFFQHFKNVLELNVPNGFLLFGNSAFNSYKLLHKNPHLITEKELYLAHVVGWAYEITREFLFIVDDVVDNSETRHGKPCWYKNSDVGLNAVIDGIMMYARVFYLLKKHFHDKPYYVQMIELIQQSVWDTYVGQMYGIQLTRKFLETRSLAEFTFENHERIAIQNATGAFYGPIIISMWMHGITDPVIHSQVKDVSVLIAKFCIELGDVLDIFGDADEMGKLPIDISGGRCAWPIVTAIPMCNSEQLKMLEENYGKPDSEAINRVTNLFVKLRLDNVYRKHAKDSYERIVKIVEGPNFLLPSNIFIDVLHYMYTKEI